MATNTRKPKKLIPATTKEIDVYAMMRKLKRATRCTILDLVDATGFSQSFIEGVLTDRLEAKDLHKAMRLVQAYQANVAGPLPLQGDFDPDD
jgi:2-keto-4-pentenoate hydratase